MVHICSGVHRIEIIIITHLLNNHNDDLLMRDSKLASSGGAAIFQEFPVTWLTSKLSRDLCRGCPVAPARGSGGELQLDIELPGSLPVKMMTCWHPPRGCLLPPRNELFMIHLSMVSLLE